MCSLEFLLTNSHSRPISVGLYISLPLLLRSLAIRYFG